MGVLLALDIAVTTFGVAGFDFAWVFLDATFLVVFVAADLALADLAPALGLAFLAAFEGVDLAFNFLTADMLFVSGRNKAGFYTKTHREKQEIPATYLLMLWAFTRL